MTTKPSTLRKRNLTDAGRSLKLIQDAVAEHAAALESGEVPDNGFAVYVIRYEAALSAVRTLDQMGEDGNEDTVEVSREALAGLIELLRASEVGYAIQDAEEDSPLGGIIAITGTGEESS